MAFLGSRWSAVVSLSPIGCGIRAGRTRRRHELRRNRRGAHRGRPAVPPRSPTIAPSPGHRTKQSRDYTRDARRSRVVIVGMKQILIELAQLYQPGHFGRNPRAFFDGEAKRRVRWLSLCIQTEGEARSGSLSRVNVAYALGEELAGMVAQIVGTICANRDGFSYPAWSGAWRKAGSGE
jgi:hypothetical protein